MDKSVLRRNKKTVHIQYSENAAILSGDAMSILATEFLLKCRASNIREVLELFTLTSLEVCEGQQYDIDFERAVKVTLESYINMIRLKTAVLIAGSLKMGALLAGASDNEANSLYNFGLNLGIAFQLRDDYLDTFGDTLKFGKKIGGDIVSNKKTFLLISAIEEAKGENLRTLEYWLGVKEFDRDEKIHNVKGVFDDLGIKEMTMKKIEEYFRKSKDCLKDIKTDPNILNELSEIADLLLEREK
jgi:geranylgeranyl diphosphate synthase type II